MLTSNKNGLAALSRKGAGAGAGAEWRRVLSAGCAHGVEDRVPVAALVLGAGVRWRRVL